MASKAVRPAARPAQQILDRTFLEMRWRVLSLAADLDRIQRADGDNLLPTSDERLSTLLQALQRVAELNDGRAEAVQLLFSDRTPPPDRH